MNQRDRAVSDSPKPTELVCMITLPYPMDDDARAAYARDLAKDDPILQRILDGKKINVVIPRRRSGLVMHNIAVE